MRKGKKNLLVNFYFRFGYKKLHIQPLSPIFLNSNNCPQVCIKPIVILIHNLDLTWKLPYKCNQSPVYEGLYFYIFDY